jgi:hypothetical protein
MKKKVRRKRKKLITAIVNVGGVGVKKKES